MTTPAKVSVAVLNERALGGPVRTRYDVAVIGGGISGVQIARHAAGRGLHTLLIERGDFGGATSSATTKAIHGGLRYLEQHDFKVVAESVAERRFLGIAAPHLVQPRSFLLTAYDWSKPAAPVMGAGVAVYEAMAINRNLGMPRDIHSPRFRWVSRKALLSQVPWLNPEGLVGGWRHDDTLNIHPERLLLAILKSFVADGGTAINHAAATGFLRGEDGRVTGVRVMDRLGGDEIEIRAAAVINAAGPWVAEALGELSDLAGVRVNQAKGVHLITRDLGHRDAVYVRGRNGHHIMVNPWEGRTLLGPTDTPTQGGADAVRATREDVDLLRETFDSVSARPLSRTDVDDTIVGVRPLVDGGDDVYTSSRRFDIRSHRGQGLAGLFTVTGGKWTTGRAMGEKTVDAVIKESGEALPPTRSFDSRKLALSTSFGDYATVADSFEAASRRLTEVALPRRTREHLARLYGTEHERLLELIADDPALARPLAPEGDCRDVAAQVIYAVTGEAARTLADVVDRRLTLGTLGRVRGTALTTVADLIAPLLGWDESRSTAEVRAYLVGQDSRSAVLDEAFGEF